MPDDTAIGKRLYVERLVAMGLTVPEARAPQSYQDYAADLVQRVIGLHLAPWRDATRGTAVLMLIFGLIVGLAAGYVAGVVSAAVRLAA